MKPPLLKLTRRPLKPIRREVDKDDANTVFGGPSYLNPITQSGGTMRPVPTLAPGVTGARTTY